MRAPQPVRHSKVTCNGTHLPCLTLHQSTCHLHKTWRLTPVQLHVRSRHLQKGIPQKRCLPSGLHPVSLHSNWLPDVRQTAMTQGCIFVKSVSTLSVPSLRVPIAHSSSYSYVSIDACARPRMLYATADPPSGMSLGVPKDLQSKEVCEPSEVRSFSSALPVPACLSTTSTPA